jgi:hypothetical protein
VRAVGLDDVAGLVAGRAGAAGVPRVVASGNFGTPLTLLRAVDAALPEYRLNLLNAQPGIPDREGVLHETSFVGPGMRRSPRLSYVPSRLSLVPDLFRRSLPPDVVLLHTTMPRGGRVSLGVEVNVLPAAVEAARSRGGVVLAQAAPSSTRTSRSTSRCAATPAATRTTRPGRRSASRCRRASPTARPCGSGSVPCRTPARRALCSARRGHYLGLL